MLLIKDQNSSSCSLYSIRSHSEAILSCIYSTFLPSKLKLPLFNNRALISSESVKGILPILRRLKTGIS